MSARPRSGACTETGRAGSGREAGALIARRACWGRRPEEADRLQRASGCLTGLSQARPSLCPMTDSVECSQMPRGILWIDLEMNFGVYHPSMNVCVYVSIIDLSSVLYRQSVPIISIMSVTCLPTIHLSSAYLSSTSDRLSIIHLLSIYPAA